MMFTEMKSCSAVTAFSQDIKNGSIRYDNLRASGTGKHGANILGAFRGKTALPLNATTASLADVKGVIADADSISEATGSFCTLTKSVFQ